MPLDIATTFIFTPVSLSVACSYQSQSIARTKLSERTCYFVAFAQGLWFAMHSKVLLEKQSRWISKTFLCLGSAQTLRAFFWVLQDIGRCSRLFSRASSGIGVTSHHGFTAATGMIGADGRSAGAPSFWSCIKFICNILKFLGFQRVHMANCHSCCCYL